MCDSERSGARGRGGVSTVAGAAAAAENGGIRAGSAAAPRVTPGAPAADEAVGLRGGAAEAGTSSEVRWAGAGRVPLLPP